MDKGHLRAVVRARHVLVAVAALGVAAPAAQAERPGSAGSPPQANGAPAAHGAPGHAAPGHGAPGHAAPGGRQGQPPRSQAPGRANQPARPPRAHQPRPAPGTPRANPRPRRATPSPRAQAPQRGRAHGRNRHAGQGGASSEAPLGAAHQKTTICHATGSATNPYVQITISDRALKAHARHQDGRDLIPAPAGGCPGGAGGAALPEAVASVPRAVNAAAARAGRLGQKGSGARGQVEVLAANRSARGGAEEPAADDAAPARTVTATSERDGLPFTGLEALLVAALGAGLVASGIAARRALGRRTAR